MSLRCVSVLSHLLIYTPFMQDQNVLLCDKVAEKYVTYFYGETICDYTVHQ